MRNYNKYKKYRKHARIENYNRKQILSKPFVTTLIILVTFFLIGLAYAAMNDMLTIKGTVNTESFTINYILNGGVNIENPITKYTATSAAALPIPTYMGYTFEGWFENDTFTGSSIKTTPTRKRSKKFNVICKMDKDTISYNL